MILENTPLLLELAVIFGFIMAWGVGANDVANAMGTSVGSKALTLKQATGIAIVFELLGAFFAGSHVSDTIRNQLVDVSAVSSQPDILVFGMLSALLSSGTWLVLASYRGWPVSTTHSIVGAVVGFAGVGIGVDAVCWQKVASIALSWVGTPLLAGLLAYLLFSSVQRRIFRSPNPVVQAKKQARWYAFAVGFLMAYVLLRGIVRFLPMHEFSIFLISLCVGLLGVWVVHHFFCQNAAEENLKRREQFREVERVFALLMVFTAAAMAFAHGSNDVANAVGPLASVVQILDAQGDVMAQGPIPPWVMMIGAGGIILGLSTWGYRVIATIGTNITQLTPSRGFVAQLSASVSVLLASGLGMPVSTTHTLVGAVLGVGFARGMGALNMGVVRHIFMSWVITLPAGAIFALIYFYLFKYLLS